MQTVAEVLSIIGHIASALPVEGMASEAALTCILAAPVKIDVDAPPFDRAMLDGYAVRAADTGPGAKLRIIGRQDAGGPLWSGEVGPQTCIAINTGAPMPAGADAVLMVEDTVAAGPVKPGPEVGELVEATRALAAGWGIQKKASDAAKGMEVLAAGTLLGPAQLAVAAGAGAAQVQAYPQPRIAVLTTGDELVGPAQIPGPTQIRNSNGPMLAGLARRYARLAADAAWSPDDAAMIRKQLDRLLALSDVVLVTGSLSMGTRDFIPQLVEEMGFATHVQTVRIRPGKPFLLATRDEAGSGGAGGRKYLVGLPGNPVSAFVCFHRFVRPLLAKLAGATTPSLAGAVTTAELKANGEREFYQPAIVDRSVFPPTVVPLQWRGSADIFTLSRANALIIRPAESPAIPAGAVVNVLEL